MQALRILSLALGLSGCLALVGCGGSDSDDSITANGSLDLNVTDAPIDGATAVVVQFDGVAIKPAGAEQLTFEFETAQQIDLLTLQGDNSAPLLEDVSVPAGDYEWVRLMVTGDQNSLDSYIEMDDGNTYPLFIPSGEQTGLKLVEGFLVPVADTADFTIDFDLRKSVVERGNSGNPYILKPTLRLVDNSAAGSLTGTVDSAIASAADCSPSAYVYSGTNVTADDEGSQTPPLTSALISMDEGTGDYTFTVGFLNEGEYTVAWTCEADLDAVETDDDISFEATTNASVTAGETTQVSF